MCIKSTGNNFNLINRLRKTYALIRCRGSKEVPNFGVLGKLLRILRPDKVTEKCLESGKQYRKLVTLVLPALLSPRKPLSETRGHALKTPPLDGASEYILWHITVVFELLVGKGENCDSVIVPGSTLLLHEECFWLTAALIRST